ncbi:MAG: WD40 repeat domain-containing protein [Gemmataceae bacterium]|nr:WD40 repeat domain-containing protein [Gemmataceae bacterium]
MTQRIRSLILGTLLALPLLALGQRPADKGARADLHGDPLPDGALARLGTARWRLGEGTRVAGFTPDGTGLVVNPNSQRPGPLQILDVTNGKERMHLPGADYTSGQFEFATRGNLMAVSHGTRLDLWEMPAGRLLRQIKVEPYPAVVAVAPDGKTVATGSTSTDKAKPCLVRLWDVASGRLLVSLDSHKTYVYALMFSADGKQLLSASPDQRYALDRNQVEVVPGFVCVWDVATHQRLAQYPNSGHTLVFAPDGRTWAYQGSDNRIRLVETAGGKELARIGVQGSAFAFTPDGKALATAGHSQPLVLWDAATGKEVRRLEGQAAGYPTLGFTPDGKTLACSTQTNWSSTGGTVRFWDVATGKEIRPYPGHPDEVACVAPAPDGKTVASGGNDGSLFLWEADTGKALHRMSGHPGGVSAVAFAPDKRLLASGGKDGQVRLWRVADGKEMRHLEGPGGAVLALTFSADGKSVWACGAKGKLQGWDVAGGAGPGAFDLGQPSLSGATFSADGSLLACIGGEMGGFGGGSSRVQVHRVRTGKKLLTLELEVGNPARAERGFEALHCWAVAFSGDGRLLATGESIQTQGLRVILGNHTIRVWELATGKQVLQVADLPVAPRHMALSPDGRLLAHGHGRGFGFGQGAEEVFFLRDLSAGVTLHQQRKDGGAVICLHSGSALRPIRDHVGRASCVAFAPDGKSLLTGGDGTLTAWAAAPFLPGPLRQPAEVSAKELQALWDQLASGDSTLGYQAIGRLELARGQTVPLLKERLKPEPAADPKRVAALIADLENRTFAVRQKAFNELAGYAEQVEEALLRALPEQRSLEAQRRVQQLLDRLDKVGLSPERLRVLRSLTLLERIGTAEARGVLETMAAGAPTRLTHEARASLRRLEQRAATARHR